MSNIPKFSGLLPDTYDNRDVLLSSIQESVDIPESYKRDISAIPIDSQGNQPACCAYAGSKVKESQELIDQGRFIDISPRALYALCKKIDGLNEDGTFLRAVMKVLYKYGAILEKDFPSDTSLSKDEFKDWTKIPREAYDMAEQLKIGGYAKVRPDWEELKQAIFQNEIVLGGMIGTRKGWSHLPLLPPKEKDKMFGHAIAYFGFDKHYIYFINSWSERWGDKGIGYFGKDMLPYLFNSWTAVDIRKKLVNPSFKNSGWVAIKYLEKVGFSEGSKVKTTARLKLRENPSLNSRTKEILKKGQIVTIKSDKVVKANQYDWQEVYAS